MKASLLGLDQILLVGDRPVVDASIKTDGDFQDLDLNLPFAGFADNLDWSPKIGAARAVGHLHPCSIYH